MITVFLALAIGFTASYFLRLSKKFYLFVEKISSIGLIFLLFMMGVQVGINQEVMSNLPIIGWQALVLASGTILGSLVFVYLLEKITTTEHQVEKELNQ